MPIWVKINLTIMIESLNQTTPENRIEKDNIIYMLNYVEQTAEVYGISVQQYEIIIPRSIIHNSTEYIVKHIYRGAFRYAKTKSVQLPPDSEIQTIENETFQYSSIESFTIPPSLTDLSKRWAYLASNLKNVKVLPNNPRYKSYSDKIIIGKKSLEDENFDVLVFCSRDARKIKIPKFIKHIGAYCFDNCMDLCTIEFEKGLQLQTIGEYGFTQASIKNFTIPSSVTIISESAFLLCNSLENFEIPDNSQLKTIGRNAFNLALIESLKIPSKLVELKEGWCMGLKKLNRILVMPENPVFSCTDEGFLIEKSSINNDVYDILSFCPRNIQHAKIPSYIKIINPFVFQTCKKLKKVEFTSDSNLNMIKSYAFTYSSIVEFSVPSQLIDIGPNAFASCKNLVFLEMPNDSKLQTIHCNAFCQTSIQCLKIPPSVENINKYAFYDCKKLLIIEISENSRIKTIRQDAFANCKILIMVPAELNIEFIYSSE